MSRTPGHTKWFQSIDVTDGTCVVRCGRLVAVTFKSTLCVSVAGLRLLDCPGLVFPYAFVPHSSKRVAASVAAPAAAAAAAVESGSDESGDDEAVVSSSAAPAASSARAPGESEYTGVDSIDRQRAMQECCGVVPLSQVRHSVV